MQDPAIPGDARARISARLGYGAPPTVLLDNADEVGADLIAIGTHGRSGFMPAVIGSMAEILLSCGHRDTLMVREMP